MLAVLSVVPVTFVAADEHQPTPLNQVDPGYMQSNPGDMQGNPANIPANPGQLPVNPGYLPAYQGELTESPDNLPSDDVDDDEMDEERDD